MTSPRRAASFLVVAGLLLFVGCGDDDTDQTVPRGSGAATSFAGEVKGSNLTLGLVAGGTRIRAYLCDDDHVGEWFTGTKEGDRFRATSAGGTRLEADVAGNRATGTVTFEGKEYEFSLPAATGDAGLYRYEGDFEGEQVLIGWIVSEDGREVGTIRRRQGIRKAPPRSRVLARRIISPT